jgi:hypothetical protein
MKSKEELTAEIAKRKAALAKQAAEGSKATPDHVRLTRSLLKRSQRRLVKLAGPAKLKDAAAAAAPTATAAAKPEEKKA